MLAITARWHKIPCKSSVCLYRPSGHVVLLCKYRYSKICVNERRSHDHTNELQIQEFRCMMRVRILDDRIEAHIPRDVIIQH